MKAKRVAIYARVSTDSQTTENQLQELRAVAQQRGWEVAGEYVDHAVSGAKGRDQRPEFDRLLKGAVRHEFDIIAAWSVDRLGRSLQDLVSFLGDIQVAGVNLYLDKQGMDTTTPSGKAMFQLCGVFAEFERSMIQERVRAGLARARAQGRVGGRPRVADKTTARILDMRAKGLGMLKIAQAVGCGTGTVQRVIREAEQAA